MLLDVVETALMYIPGEDNSRRKEECNREVERALILHGSLCYIRYLRPERDPAGGVWELARGLRAAAHDLHGAHGGGPAGAAGRCHGRVTEPGRGGIRNRTTARGKHRDSE